MAVQPRVENTAQAVLWMSIAMVLFTCNDTTAKWLIGSGVGALQVVFCRYFGALILSLIVYVPQEGRTVLKSNRPKLQAIRSSMLLLSTVLNFSALKYLPLTLTTTVMFASPVVITLLSIPMLGERVGIRRFAAVFVGFLGVVYVIQPWGADFHPAIFLNLGGLLCASLYFVMTRMLAGIEGSATSQIWANGIASASLAPLVLPNWYWPVETDVLFLLSIIGFFGGMGHILATRAHRMADASILAPLVYLQLFTAALASYLVFATTPANSTFIGGAVVIASGLYIWQRERKHANRT